MMMIHHVREIQMRLLMVAAVLLVGMVVGYLFYVPLFEFIKSPLHGSLHYMSPSGSFMFIIKICLMVGVVAAVPVAVFNAIMFVQPALVERLSRKRVIATTVASFTLALAGAAFGFLGIIPLALHFFYGFQLDGLVAIISADEYLRFVMGIVITFAIIFQLPLLMSLADHVTPLPPKKLLKFEKYVVLGSILIAVVVPFANDLTVQALVASPVIVLYNVAIGVVILQQAVRARRQKRQSKKQPLETKTIPQPESTVRRPIMQTPAQGTSVMSPSMQSPGHQPITTTSKPAVVPTQASTPLRRPVRSIDGTFRMPTRPRVQPARRVAPRRVISDFRGPMVASSRPQVLNQPGSLADENMPT
ncbi:MAG TPA: twin-arginine translocase subunit TatC [Candidatus Saccharimonadales bacterium]